MISIDTNFESLILRTRVNVKIYLPNPLDFMHPVKDYRAHYQFAPFKTVFLLHGLMDDGGQWVENTNLLWMAQEAGLALVIPSCGNNFYVNTIYGAAYSDFISKELPGFVRGIFPLSDKREDNFLWGISMGGYGALRLCLTKPEMFSKVIAMSPTTDIEFSARFATAMGVEAQYVIGHWKELKGSDKDLETLAVKAAETYGAEAVPDLLFILADQDYFVRNNEDYRQILDSNGLKNEFRVYPGAHTWGFWARHTQECIEWLTGRAILDGDHLPESTEDGRENDGRR